MPFSRGICPPTPTDFISVGTLSAASRVEGPALKERPGSVVRRPEMKMQITHKTTHEVLYSDPAITLERADLQDRLLDGAELAHVNLRAACLVESSLIGAVLIGAVLDSANLRASSLRGARMNGASLRGANLVQADLRGADLFGADLTGADLTGADLTGANLSHVKLVEANLSDATLESADFQAADLRGTVFTDTSFVYSLYDDTTVWPAGFDPDRGSVILLPIRRTAPLPAPPASEGDPDSYCTALAS